MATSTDSSRQLTASAEALLQVEKQMDVGSDLQAKLYEDVLTLLNSAIDADPGNAHAHALSAGVLLLKSSNGDGTYDVCYLLDAKDEANEVLTHAARGTASDLAAAKAVLTKIARIPASAIPDSASNCDDRDEQQHGIRTRLKAR